jgi:hypothetical protein
VQIIFLRCELFARIDRAFAALLHFLEQFAHFALGAFSGAWVWESRAPP